MTDNQDIAALPAAGWRLKLGGAMLAVSIVGPLILLPMMPSLGLSGAMMATVSGGVLIGAEVLAVAAVAVMGKSGYAYIKNRALGFLKQYGPPAEVSRTRYTIGLVMFAGPVLFGLVTPYAATLIPAYEGNEIAFAMVGDLILLASLFVLGGDFWDKVRALFIHGAKAVLPK
jgi:hypothetical protein